MDDELLSPSTFAEATNMDTPSERLAEFADYTILQPLIAANPNTPASVLKQLSEAGDPAIRRAVAQNPNAPVQVIRQLAGEFPHEFFRNPLISILNMTNPDFIKGLSPFSWMSLLRFENLPIYWLEQIKNHRSYSDEWMATQRLLHLHVVTQKNRAPEQWRTRANSELKGYRKSPPKRAVVIDPTDEMDILLLFVSLFPHTAPMMRKQWAKAAHAQPRQIGIVLAASRTVSSKTLRVLLNEKDIFVRCQVLRHPSISTKTLAGLANHGRSEIRRAVASNPHTPQASIATLISDSDPAVRRAAVTHPSLTTKDYEVMILDEDKSVRATLATLPQLDHTLLTQLANDSAPRIRATVARNIKVSADLLTTLARDPDPTVRAASAGNSRLPSETQSVLLADHEEIVRAHLSKNARLLAQHTSQLAQDSSLRVRKYLAANPNTSPTLLDQLWQTGEMEIWQGLARNPQASPELLTQLARQGDIRVQTRVAAHKHTTVEVLHELAGQNKREIWYGLVANPHTPLAILELAYTTAHVELQLRIINHPVMVRNHHRPLLALLANKIQQLIAPGYLPNWLRQAVFQYYTALPATIVEPFASSPYWEERYIAACHAHISTSVLDMLTHDGICYVREAAQDMLKRREQTPDLLH